MSLYFITGNKNKFKEIKSMLPNLERLNIDLPEIQSMDSREIIKEKLLSALKHKKAKFIVEDTSLYLDCLNGLPGPFIKWFLDTIGNKGLFEIAKKFSNQKAKAQTIIGYTNGTDIYYFEGSIDGKIVFPKEKTNFGWDPIFQPSGYSKSFAELSREEKNKISMRKIAVSKLKKFINN